MDDLAADTLNLLLDCKLRLITVTIVLKDFIWTSGVNLLREVIDSLQAASSRGNEARSKKREGRRERSLHKTDPPVGQASRLTTYLPRSHKRYVLYSIQHYMPITLYCKKKSGRGLLTNSVTTY